MDDQYLKQIKYWGASTSAHQYEGKNYNQWTEWELSNASELAQTAPDKYKWLPRWDEVAPQATKPDNYVSGIAVDHYSRYEEDYDLAKSLNLNSMRISIEWSRIEPKKGEWDEVEIDHYRNQLKSLRRHGFEPFVCLWHWTMPIWFTKSGGFANRTNIKYFVRFCEKIAVELGELFTYVITLNEPNVYVGQSYQSGIWPPQHKSLLDSVRVYRNLIKAHIMTYRSLKNIRKRFKIGLAMHMIAFYAGNSSAFTRLSIKIRSYIWNWYYLNRSRDFHDYIGINYYMANQIVGLKTKNPDRQVSDMGWNMEPARIELVLLEAHKRFDKPIIVTENGVADSRDAYRQWWLEQTFRGMSRAIEKGAKIDGYLHWSLLDNFEWADGFWPRFGLIEIDRSTLARKPRTSSAWYGNRIKHLISK